jgi:hypothetical protein
MTTLDDALAAVMKARLAMRAAGLDGADLARVARWIAAEIQVNELAVQRGSRSEQKQKQKKICTTETEEKRRTATKL